jgi:hypothetical protein
VNVYGLVAVYRLIARNPCIQAEDGAEGKGQQAKEKKQVFKTEERWR